MFSILLYVCQLHFSFWPEDAMSALQRTVYRDCLRLARLHDRLPHLKALLRRPCTMTVRFYDDVSETWKGEVETSALQAADSMPGPPFHARIRKLPRFFDGVSETWKSEAETHMADALEETHHEDETAALDRPQLLKMALAGQGQIMMIPGLNQFHLRWAGMFDARGEPWQPRPAERFVEQLMCGGEYFRGQLMPPCEEEGSDRQLGPPVSAAALVRDFARAAPPQGDEQGDDLLDTAFEVLRLFSDNVALAEEAGLRTAQGEEGEGGECPAPAPGARLVLAPAGQKPRRGSLLVAHPAVVDPCFGRALLLMCHHHASVDDNGDGGGGSADVAAPAEAAAGSLGLILNKPTPHTLSELPDFDAGALAGNALFYGGPVLDGVHLLHCRAELAADASLGCRPLLLTGDGEEEGAAAVAQEGGGQLYHMRGKEALAAAAAMVADGRAEASDFKLLLGSARWGDGQLDGEVEQNSWLTVLEAAAAVAPSVDGAAGVGGGGDGGGHGGSAMRELAYAPRGVPALELQQAAKGAAPPGLSGYASLHKQHVPACGTALWGDVLRQLGGEYACWARLAEKNEAVYAAVQRRETRYEEDDGDGSGVIDFIDFFGDDDGDDDP